MTVTVTLTVQEALFAKAALERAKLQARAAKSGDDWLDRTAVDLYGAAADKLERALYAELVPPTVTDNPAEPSVTLRP